MAADACRWEHSNPRTQEAAPAGRYSNRASGDELHEAGICFLANERICFAAVDNASRNSGLTDFHAAAISCSVTRTQSAPARPSNCAAYLSSARSPRLRTSVTMRRTAGSTESSAAPPRFSSAVRTSCVCAAPRPFVLISFIVPSGLTPVSFSKNALALHRFRAKVVRPTGQASSSFAL